MYNAGVGFIRSGLQETSNSLYIRSFYCFGNSSACEIFYNLCCLLAGILNLMSVAWPDSIPRRIKVSYRFHQGHAAANFGRWFRFFSQAINVYPARWPVVSVAAW